MKFDTFGDVFYSVDKSAYFIRYTNTAVKKQKMMQALRYSPGTYGDATQFRDACLAKCAGEKACGGVVFQYYGSKKDTLKKCNFKALEPTVRTDSGKKKDFYRRVCYGDGPGGYPMPDDGSDNETACAMFGKTLVKTASGTIVAPTTCNDGDLYTKANDAACQAAGKSACWDEDSSRDTQFLPWVVGAVKLSDYEIYSDCFRVCAINDLCYGSSAEVEYKDSVCAVSSVGATQWESFIGFGSVRRVAYMLREGVVCGKF